MSNVFASWQAWALLSAAFAALTAIFAKVGVQTIDSDLATFLRTIVILAALGLFLLITGRLELQPLQGKALTFLVLSGGARNGFRSGIFNAWRAVSTHSDTNGSKGILAFCSHPADADRWRQQGLSRRALAIRCSRGLGWWSRLGIAVLAGNAVAGKQGQGRDQHAPCRSALND